MSGAFAVLTAGLCVLYAQEVRGESERQRADVIERFGGESVRLVVASETIEAGETAGSQNAREKEWASELAPEGALTSLDDVAGRKVTVPAAKGAPLTELNFRDTDEMPEVPAGYMAVQVPLSDKLGLPSAVPAGSRLVAYGVSDEGTRLISGDVKVLVAASADATSISRGSASLAVKPEAVSSVLAASAEGSLRLVVPAADVESGEANGAPTRVDAVGQDAVAAASSGKAGAE